MNQPLTSSALADKLKTASDGLQFMSEADYPFEVLCWDGLGQTPLTAELVLQQTGHAPETPVEIVQLEDFFQNATHEQDWYTPEEKETVARFQALVEMLKQNLTDIQVYRLGTVEIDIYIIGKTPDGNFAGLSTKIVET